MDGIKDKKFIKSVADWANKFAKEDAEKSTTVNKCKDDSTFEEIMSALGPNFKISDNKSKLPN